LENIQKEHQKQGNNSPLKNNPQINMNQFEQHRSEADSLRADSEDLREQSEAKMQQANSIYGRAKGQNINTPDTLYNSVDIIKDILLLVYKGNEEKLSEWGFKVVIGQAKSPKPRAK
jgi:hypothetical protein